MSISGFDPAATGLPVAAILPELEKALAEKGRAVLCAPPGGGKSTLIPPAFSGAGFLHGGRIVMLEPRRLAARNTAKRIAFLTHSEPGKIAGCHTRFDNIGNHSVPIDVVTEGILLRMLQSDPELPGVGLLIFDEFHERSIEADTGLALALDTASVLRPDLKILVMSATMDAARVSALLKTESGKPAPVIVSQGRMFPVETIYRKPDGERTLAQNVGSAIVDALNHYPGDILVFLPGEGEIRQCMSHFSALFPDGEKQGLLAYALYGNLPPERQDEALLPPLAGKRKIIFSTPVAETSLTVEGVRIVIDSGWMRQAVFSPGSGMDHLETMRVSRASADQRRGRAGRTGPGVCIRLWHPAEERSFHAFNTPGILQADLTPMTLQLAKWGISPDRISELDFLDVPPSAAMTQAWDLLEQFKAVKDGRITPYGEELLRMPLHPRLAHMIAQGSRMGKKDLAAAIGALVSEKDVLFAPQTADIRERLSQLSFKSDKMERGRGVDRMALDRVRNILRQDFRSQFEFGTEDAAGLLLSFAFPDRIARRRAVDSMEYILANGKSARLLPGDPLIREEYLCIASAEGLSNVPKIRLCAPVDPDSIPENLMEKVMELNWNSSSKALEAFEVLRLGSLSVRRKPVAANLEKIPMEQRAAALLRGLRQHGPGILPWSENQRSIMRRTAFLHKYMGDACPLLSPETLFDTMEEWLVPFLDRSCNSVSALTGGVLAAAFDTLFDYSRKRELDTLAPERIEVPTGSKIKVDYDSDPPHLAVRLQEIFGMKETPLIAGGRVHVVMEILSPAMRPIQVTSDLAGFWKSSYFLVRKEMRGRYPKHDWPEDPANAVPHRGVRKPQN